MKSIIKLSKNADSKFGLRFPVGENTKYSLVKEKCTACTICEKVCPTHAIKVESYLETTDKTFYGLIGLHLNHARCVGCDLCVKACPEQALETSEVQIEITENPMSLIENLAKPKKRRVTIE